MSNVFTLDCTLRDGGYCNQWNFRKQNIEKIIKGLVDTRINLIECGFLTNKVSYDADKSKFTELSQLNSFLPSAKESSEYVVMINFGEYAIEDIPECEETPIDGIRVAFHKKKMTEAMSYCKAIGEKGYKVFVQPMVTMLYSDEEFASLISLANDINPYAFYIVDSFGTMNSNVLNHYFEITEKLLNEDVAIGFHSHNNMQSAFANARVLLGLETKHNLIIDSSIYGMGRGAGNLNTELFLNELNIEKNSGYDIRPILQLMDDVINRFYEEKPWGYSLPNYLSAMHMIHPNYAGYLSDKKTVTIEDMHEIFSLMDVEKGVEYDEKYIEELYIKYLSGGKIRSEHLNEIKERVKNRKLLLIAPGKNATRQSDRILDFVKQQDVVSISINHEYPVMDTDYIFVSNIRRFNQLNGDVLGKTISTSNIKSQDTYVSIDYNSLLNDVDLVKDNAGLMAINFAIKELGVDEVYIAGLDGYSHDVYQNFETPDMALLASAQYLDGTNKGVKQVLGDYSSQIKIHFLTESLLG